MVAPAENRRASVSAAAARSAANASRAALAGSTPVVGAGSMSAVCRGQTARRDRRLAERQPPVVRWDEPVGEDPHPAVLQPGAGEAEHDEVLEDPAAQRH